MITNSYKILWCARTFVSAGILIFVNHLNRRFLTKRERKNSLKISCLHILWLITYIHCISALSKVVLEDTCG